MIMIASGVVFRGGSIAATVACIPNSSLTETCRPVVVVHCQRVSLVRIFSAIGRSSSPFKSYIAVSGSCRCRGSEHELEVGGTGYGQSHGFLKPCGRRKESKQEETIFNLSSSSGLEHDQPVHFVDLSKMRLEYLPSRRAALCSVLGALGLSLVQCDAASADFSPGFPVFKDWLKGQKQKTSSFLLAPINASRDRLSSALDLISADYISSSSYEEAENLVKVAARDCMPLEAGSLLDFQSRSGVEVCTFKLVLKNASSLLDKTDPVKLKAEELLDDLIKCFVNLDEILASGASGGSPDRKNLTGALLETSVALDRFEGGVRTCLGIA